jgi:dihydrolipoamide dehydrogenase
MSKVVIVGGGIAGYNAALNLSGEHEVTLIERENVGGVCLNKGCIPTKFFYENSEQGNLAKLKEEKDIVVRNLRASVEALIRSKKIKYVNGVARIVSENSVLIKESGLELEFDKLIIAIGSSAFITWL